MVEANYGAKQPSTSAYIKSFIPGSNLSLWKIFSFNYKGKNIDTVTTTSNKYDNIYIQGDLYIKGKIIYNPICENPIPKIEQFSFFNKYNDYNKSNCEINKNNMDIESRLSMLELEILNLKQYRIY